MNSQEGKELRSGNIYPFEQIYKATGTGGAVFLSPQGVSKRLFKTPKPPNLRVRNRQVFHAQHVSNETPSSKYKPDLLDASPVLSRTHSAPDIANKTDDLHDDIGILITGSHTELNQPKQKIKITTPFSSFGSLNSLGASGEITYPLNQLQGSSPEVNWQPENEAWSPLIPPAPAGLHVNPLVYNQGEAGNPIQLIQGDNNLDQEDLLDVLLDFWQLVGVCEVPGQPLVNNMAGNHYSAAHRPPTFLGTGSEDANEFMRLFKLYCDIHGDATVEPAGANAEAAPATANAVRRFQLNISGDCARWFAELPDRTRFPAIEAAFIEKYCNRADNWAENVQLRQIIQMPAQSVENYLKKFSDQARRIGKPLRTCITDIVEGFLPEIQREVLMMCPQTIDDVIKYAKLAEVVCNKLQLQGSKGTSESAQLAQVNHMVREREDLSKFKEDIMNAILEVNKASSSNDSKPKGGAQVNQYQNQQKGQNNNNNSRNPRSNQFSRGFQGNCYNCGFRGHRASECRKPGMQNSGGYNAGYNRGYSGNYGGNFRGNPIYQGPNPNSPPAIAYNSPPAMAYNSPPALAYNGQYGVNRDSGPHNIQNPMDQLSDIVKQGTAILNALRPNSN
jgi:hypothetical protein